MPPELMTIFASATGVLIAQSNNDLLLSSRGHERFLQLMDRCFLSDALEESATMAKTASGLNVASHVPFVQPWAPPTRPGPVGT